jgi:hypothetical protein
MMLLNLFHFIYLSSIDPFQDKWLSRAALVNDIFMTICTINMLMFTDWVELPEDQYFYGWSMIGVIIICMAFNLYFVLKLGANSIKLLFIRIFNRVKFKVQQLLSKI